MIGGEPLGQEKFLSHQLLSQVMEPFTLAILAWHKRRGKQSESLWNSPPLFPILLCAGWTASLGEPLNENLIRHPGFFSAKKDNVQSSRITWCFKFCPLTSTFFCLNHVWICAYHLLYNGGSLSFHCLKSLFEKISPLWVKRMYVGINHTLQWV